MTRESKANLIAYKTASQPYFVKFVTIYKHVYV